MTRPSNLVDLLHDRASRHPDRVALIQIEDDGRDSPISYGELDRRARSIAAHLVESGLAGERALLLHPQGVEYVVAFAGCLYAGVAAVPLYPPAHPRLLPRLRAIARDAAPSVALTTSAVEAALRAAGASELGALRLVATDALDDRSAAWRRPDVAHDALAFLQYTSGSTASPKGVMVSHANLVHNERALERCWHHDERTVVVSWLPLFHDMGLVGNALQALFVGGRGVLLSPIQFLHRPLRWLEAITKHRATTSGGPNFAYDLCVEKIGEAEKAALELSSWTVAFDGAEPVRAATLERFATAFASCGFRRGSLFPGYGLAESTLVVTASRLGAGPVTLGVRASALEAHQVADAPEGERDRRVLVGSGRAVIDAEIAIVAPETGARVAPGAVGEIWVASPSVARGYWRRDDETRETFEAALDGKRWLRTGDLGFLRDGELFVTGRLKDLIVVRGRNHYPQDLEWSVESSHAALRSGGTAAFSVEIDDEEHVVVVAEVEKTFDPVNAPAVFDAMRRVLARDHDLRLHAAALIAPGALPKTTSGKVQRQACRRAFEANELAPIAAADFRRDAVATRAPRRGRP